MTAVHLKSRRSALLVVPPYSGSDTNPPLGPAVLAAAAHGAGHRATVLDLNRIWIAQHGGPVAGRSLALGDHGKSRASCESAWRRLKTLILPVNSEPVSLPNGADPIGGCHFNSQQVNDWARSHLRARSALYSWLQSQLTELSIRPDVIGISLMGPAQVWCGMLTALISREIWPDVPIVCGGSHPTLLRESIKSQPSFGAHFDAFLPGHSEHVFVEMLNDPLNYRQLAGVILAGARTYHQRAECSPLDHVPLFSQAWLELYDERLTVPVQFVRGCSYGRCKFCTYPIVEPTVTAFDPSRSVAIMRELAQETGSRKFSIKDSLFTIPNMERLAVELLQSGPEVSWSATTKAVPELGKKAGLLRKSGLVTVELGVETIHSRTQVDIDKLAGRTMIERTIGELADAGVHVVVNLIFGLPSESVSDAQTQIAWAGRLRSRYGSLVSFSAGMLEIERLSPFALDPPPEMEIGGVADWAHSFAWDRPDAWLSISELVRQATESGLFGEVETVD